MFDPIRRWWRRLSGAEAYDNALRAVEKERAALAALSLEELGRWAAGFAEDPRVYEAVTSLEPFTADLLSPDVHPSVSGWFASHPALRTADGVTVACVRPSESIEGHTCVAADMDGAEYFASNRTGEVFERVADKSLELVAPSLPHAVVWFAWQAAGGRDAAEARG